MDENIGRVVPINPYRDILQSAQLGELGLLNSWTLRDFVQAFRVREVNGVKLEIATLWPWGGSSRTRWRFVGFLIYCRTKTGTLDIWNMAIDPRYRRMGYGTVLIDDLKSRLDRVCHRRELRVLVDEYNLDAQLFLRSCNFLCGKILRRYWGTSGRDRRDAYSMVYPKPSRPVSRFQFGEFVDVANF